MSTTLCTVHSSIVYPTEQQGLGTVTGGKSRNMGPVCLPRQPRANGGCFHKVSLRGLTQEQDVYISPTGLYNHLSLIILSQGVYARRG
jgi:hypothetical protein